MSSKLENKLGDLMHEIKEIKKDIILQKVKKADIAKHKISAWKKLADKVSAKWDNISAVEEITQQREKSW